MRRCTSADGYRQNPADADAILQMRTPKYPRPHISGTDTVCCWCCS